MPKQKTNPPSKTVDPSIDSLFSAFFFEMTADFGHVRGVRLQDLDDFSIACAWTENSDLKRYLNRMEKVKFAPVVGRGTNA